MAARYEDITVEMELQGFDGVTHATAAAGADIVWKLTLTNPTSASRTVGVYVDLPELFAAKLEWAAATGGPSTATGFTAASTGPHDVALDDEDVVLPPGAILVYTITTATLAEFHGTLALVARVADGEIRPGYYADHKPVFVGLNPDDQLLDHDSFDVLGALYALFPKGRAEMQPIFDFVEQGYTLADLIRNAHPTLAVNDELMPFNPDAA